MEKKLAYFEVMERLEKVLPSTVVFDYTKINGDELWERVESFLEDSKLKFSSEFLMTPSFVSCFLSTGSNTVDLTKVVFVLATTTISHPGSTSGTIEASAARITLFARLRFTAPPIFLLVVMPTRLVPSLLRLT